MKKFVLGFISALVGKYVIYFNGINFPKEYGDSPTVPVEISKDQTREIIIPLTQ